MVTLLDVQQKKNLLKKKLNFLKFKIFKFLKFWKFKFFLILSHKRPLIHHKYHFIREEISMN